MRRFKELGASVVFVTTERGNMEAIRLYEKLGFRLCRGPWFYWDAKGEKYF